MIANIVTGIIIALGVICLITGHMVALGLLGLAFLLIRLAVVFTKIS